MIRRIHVPPTTVVGRPALSQLDNHNRMLTAYSKCVRTYMSGAATGSGPTTMRFRLIGIRKDPKRAKEKRRAEAPGGTKSRFHVARHVPASRRNSNTLITAFGSFAKWLAKHSALSPWSGQSSRVMALSGLRQPNALSPLDIGLKEVDSRASLTCGTSTIHLPSRPQCVDLQFGRPERPPSRPAFSSASR